MGLNEADRLKNAGIHAKKASISRVPVRELYVETSGPTMHPRWSLPVDPNLRDHIIANGMTGRDGVPWQFLVRERWLTEDRMVLELGNGSRRTKAALAAEDWLREFRPRQAPLQFDRADPNDLGRLHVSVELNNVEDAEFLLIRLAANSEPGKLPDSAEVLAITVAQLTACGCDDLKAICAVMPRGVGPKEVAALSRWSELTPESRALYVASDAPVVLLAAVLEGPRGTQTDRLEKLLAEGVKSAAGATRHIRREREERTGEPAAKARRWNPAKLIRCAKAISVPSFAIVPEKMTDDVECRFDRDQLIALIDQAEARGFAKAMLFAAGEKTGKIPPAVRTAIKAVNGQGKK